MNAQGRAKAVLVGDLNMLRSFAGTGVSTVVVSPNPRDLTFCSRYCDVSATIPDPNADQDQAVRALVGLASGCPEKPVLFYGDDSMLLLLSRRRSELTEFYRYRMPPTELVEACVDKCQFTALAAERGVPVPRGIGSDVSLTSEAIVRELGLPCVIKPNRGIGWFTSEAVRRGGGKPTKMLLASTREELDRLIEGMATSSPEFVVQEYIPGGEDAIYSYHAYVDGTGRIVGEYVGRKIRTYPAMGGVSTYVRLVDEPRAAALGRQAVERLGVTGVVKVDLKRDVTRDRYLVLELNLRFNLWNYLGTACGVNLPLLAYLDNCGLSVPANPGRWRTDVRWLSFGDDVRSMVRDYAPSGQISWWAWLRSLGAPKVYEMFAWNDPVPFAVNLARYSGLLAARLTGRAQ